MIKFQDAKVRKNNEITKEATEVIKPAVTLTLVCYEKFERIETSQLQNCFTKHDFFIEKA